MRFENPAIKTYKEKYEKEQSYEVIEEDTMKLDEEKQQEENIVDSNIIELSDILNQNNVNQEQIDLSMEYIRTSNNAKITDVPRGISLNPEQLGRILIKYENSFEESISKGM